MTEYNLNKEELREKLQLIQNSKECPECGWPIGNIIGKLNNICEYCGNEIKNDKLIDQTKVHLSYLKLKSLADLQVSTAIMSSRMDIKFNQKIFIERKDVSEIFNKFYTASCLKKKLFLLLGEAGFGKTWLVSHWAYQLQKEGYPVFILQLREGIDFFFNIVFQTTRTQAIPKIINTLNENDDQKPLIWIMDGYDEIYSDDERRLLLAEFLNLISKHKNQKIIITSRSYDWGKCRVVNNQEKLISRLLWTSSLDDLVSFRLNYYSHLEIKNALQNYGLPVLSKWNNLLSFLAPFPLWVRIISEWFRLEKKLPNIVSRELFDKYFKRMNIKHNHLRELGDFSLVLAKKGSFSKPLSLIEQSNISNDIMNTLNSSGIFHYTDDLYDPTIRLSTSAFGWYGIAFHALIQYKSKKKIELEKIWGILHDNISEKEIEVIKNLFLSMGGSIDLNHLSINNNKNIEEMKIQSKNNDHKNKSKKEQNIPYTGKVDSEVGEYHSISLNYNDSEILNNLEILLGEEIPEVFYEDWEFYTFGYVHRDLHVVQLGLSDRGLKNFPHIISKFKKLTEISLNNNELQLLPECFEDINHLNYLNLSENKFEEFPKIILKLENLKYLSLAKNQLVKLPETIGKVLSLEKLIISYNDLISLPKSIGNLKFLNDLDIESNLIEFIPDTVGNLNSLRFLNMSNNPIKNLPQNICKLQSLERIWLENIHFKDFHPSVIHWLDILQKEEKLSGSIFHPIKLPNIENMSSNQDDINKNELIIFHSNLLIRSDVEILLELERFLKKKFSSNSDFSSSKMGFKCKNNCVNELWIKKMNIESLPESIGNLNSIEFLYISHNKIKFLPESIGNLESLQALHVSHNKLTHLPDSIGNLKFLRYLNVIINNLNFLPESIGKLVALEELWLSYNKLTHLPDSIGNLESLKKMLLIENPLNNLPKSIVNLRNLIVMQLGLNKNKKFSDSIQNWKQYLMKKGCKM